MTKLKAGERGSALILVMGVLVLLSIVGTAFVTISRIERRATRNYADDIEVRLLAQQAAAFVAQHPNWEPPRDALTPSNNDVDNDNIGGLDSQWFTYPLADLSADTQARFAILKKPFGGRLDLNRVSHFVGGTSQNHILNEGASPGEISLVDAIAAYLDKMNVDEYSTDGSPANNRLVAEEMVRRIVNLRYGLPARPLAGDATDPAGNVAQAWPGEDAIDDDKFLDDSTLAVEPPVPPASHDLDDAASWATGNWRPDPARDGVDNDGDGEIDEAGEEIDEPDEYTEVLAYRMLTGSWPQNDDQPYGSADLQDIVMNTGTSDIGLLVNYVCQQWAVTAGYSYNAGFPYFDYLRVLFTTYSRDYVGDMAPLNHLNLLMPDAASAEEEAMVDADRASFRKAMAAALASGGMGAESAENTAWQVLVNLIDYLDEDPDGAGGDEGLLTVLVKPEGWRTADDDKNGDGAPSLWNDAGTLKVEPNCRAFFGTERFPHLNEIWIYNRGDDRFDNDGDGTVDNDPAALPADPAPYEVDRNGYFVELVNLYATDIILYNNPAVASEATLNWSIRIVDGAGGIKATYAMADAQKWDGAGWVTAQAVVVPAGGYLIIQSRDYSGSDNAALNAAGLKQLPTPTTIPANTVMVDLTPLVAADYKMIEAGDSVELVYSYDEDGTGAEPAVEAVVDRQAAPPDILTREKSNGTPGTRDFAPSWERHDPRIARVIRGAAGVGEELLPTWGYSLAEGGAAGTGGDQVRNTLGAVNDADDGDADVFDGNYDLGKDNITERYDDLVEVPNVETRKFGNVGLLGNLLCVGPLAPTPTDFGWSDPATVSTSDEDYWLVKCSPYTAAPGAGGDYFSQNLPLDAKKIDFISDQMQAWDSVWYDVDAASDTFPTGRAAGIFDQFTTVGTRRDGKDNDGDWSETPDGRDEADTDGDTIIDPAPTPGDGHVDEADEVYAYGRVNINESSEYVLAALPFVQFNNSRYGPLPLGSAVNPLGIFLTATEDTESTAIGIIGERLAGGVFTSRADFVERVVKPAVNAGTYNPGGNVGAFGRDLDDNHIYEDSGAGNALRRVSRPWMWYGAQRQPRTETLGAGEPYDFILPGAPLDGGDLLFDDKQEIDHTVGALMSAVALESELPEDFAAGTGGAPGGDTGIFTYYITVQVTDGADVDGVDGNGPDSSPTGTHGNDANEPDWAEGTVLAEKRIIMLVNTDYVVTDPRRVTMFNWAVEGKAPIR